MRLEIKNRGKTLTCKGRWQIKVNCCACLSVLFVKSNDLNVTEGNHLVVGVGFKVVIKTLLMIGSGKKAGPPRVCLPGITSLQKRG